MGKLEIFRWCLFLFCYTCNNWFRLHLFITKKNENLSFYLGDLVPGKSITSTQVEGKLVICALYVLFGLSLMAMCFNLMQEEVRAKFRRLGNKLGIIDDPNFW